MKIKGRFLFFIIVLLLIGLVAFRVVSNLNETKEEDLPANGITQERVIPVQTTQVKQGDMKSFLTVTGLVEPVETVKVNAKVVGQVKEVLVSEGDEVQKGDILIRLDDEQISLQVAQANATLDSAKASLEKVRAGARPQEIKQAEAAMQQAKINLDSAEESFQRMEKLFSEGAVSEQQYDQAKGQFEIAQAQHQSAKERYELIKEGASEEDIKVTQAQVRQAQSALNIVKAQLDNTIIRAPIGGKVTAILAKIGEMISSAVPILTILDVSELYVKSGISEKDIASVRISQEVEILIDAFPRNQFKGEVVTKGAAVDPQSKTLEIRIKIIDPETEIPPGVFARANILIEKKANTLIIPDTALTRKKDGLFVFVVNGEMVEKRTVTSGITRNKQVEILQGLQKDEEIVILGNITLEDGDRIIVNNRGKTD